LAVKHCVICGAAYKSKPSECKTTCSPACAAIRRGRAREKDLTGLRFERLVARRRLDAQKHECWVWECVCDCGKTVTARTDALTTGEVKSCGCLHSDAARERARTVRDGNLSGGTNVGNIAKNARPSRNTSGVRGVSWHKGVKAWQARIQAAGVKHHLGYYQTLEGAAEARREAEEQYFAPLLEGRKQKKAGG